MIAPNVTRGKCQTGIPALLSRTRRPQPTGAARCFPTLTHREFHRIVKEIIVLPEFGPLISPELCPYNPWVT